MLATFSSIGSPNGLAASTLFESKDSYWARPKSATALRPKFISVEVKIPCITSYA